MIIKCTSVLNTKWTNHIYWIQLHLHVYVAVIFMISKDGNLHTTCTLEYCNTYWGIGITDLEMKFTLSICVL